MEIDRPGGVRIALCGMAGLAGAIGVGRFAFTPMLPMMQGDGVVSAQGGAWLAAANYLGYLIGAMACTRSPPDPARAVRNGMAAVAFLTLAMGMTSGAGPWLLLRFAAGIASAYVLVGVSAWAVPALSTMGRSRWAGYVYSGVGLGMTAVGMLTLASGIMGVASSCVWIALGGLAGVLAILVWRGLSAVVCIRPERAPVGHAFGPHDWRLVLAYGLFGFGYIVCATFLPALARDAGGEAGTYGTIWPIVGIAAAVSTVVTIPVLDRFGPRRIWNWATLVLVAGVTAPAVSRAHVALLFSAACVGGTFMVITMTGMLEAKRQAMGSSARLMAAMTAAFALGQVTGPLLVGAIARHSSHAIAWASFAAAACLLASLWFLNGRAAVDSHFLHQKGRS